MLQTDDDLASLHGDSGWEPLVTESPRRQAAAAQTPAVGEHHLTDHLPVTGSVVALHAGGGRVRHTAETWMPVATLGYDLHVPGSSQRMSHDQTSWNDRDLAYHEIVEQVRPQLRTDRVIAVGRSQGASRAAELASRNDLPIVGLVLVALAPMVEQAPQVQVPAYVIAGGQDQPQYLERIDAFVGFQSNRGAPVHLERLVDMSHEYPEPFTPYLENALHWFLLGEHMADHPPVEGFVFTSPNGELLRRTNFRRRTFLPAVRESVGEPMRFHDLRHTHVAMLIAQGEHPKVIQTRLGHSSIQVTLDLYGHLFEGLDEAAAARLDATFDSSRADQTRTKRDHGVIALPSLTRTNPR